MVIKKILLSAYACEPNRGSEPGLGWNWALELARRGHEIWVLTRANNKSAIEEEFSRIKVFPNLHFIYYDLPVWLRWWKAGPLAVHFYSFLWQIGAYRKAKQIHKVVSFDVVHHVSFGSIRHASFMGRLGIPFLFGPVGGCESVPYPLRQSFPLKGLLIDFVRDISNAWLRCDPFMWYTFKTATHILVTSEENRRMVPQCFWHKTHVHLAVCANLDERRGEPLESISGQPIRVLYVGRLIYWKGVHLAIEAFARYHQSNPASTFTIIGRGPEEGRLRALVKQLNMSHAITFQTAYLNRDELLGSYAQFDIFLFPSLRESGGQVILEAFTNSLPVICFDLGGPGIIGNNTCGRVVPTTHLDQNGVVEGMVKALVDLKADIDEGVPYRQHTYKRAQVLSWETTVSQIYDKLINKPQLTSV